MSEIFPPLPWEMDPPDPDYTRDLGPLLREALAPAPSPTLTAQQQKFLNLATSWQTVGLRIIVLQGEGGSGKTFVLSRLAQQVPDMLFVAPTHQARNVLFEELCNAGLEDPQTTTVASLLGKVPDRGRPPAGDVLELNFCMAAGEPFDPGTVIVVDEASMVDLSDIRIIAARNKRGLTILSGDPYQLPPVQGTAAWDALEKTIVAGEGAKVVLDRNLRSEEPDLTDWINEVRRTGQLPEKPCSQVTYYKDRKTWHEALKQTLEEHGAHNVIALAYTNASVNATAAVVRGSSGYPEHQAATGEILRIAGTYGFLDWREEFQRLSRTMDRDQAFKEASARVKSHQLQTGDLVEVLHAFDPTPYSVGWAFGRPWRQPVKVRILTGNFRDGEVTLYLAEIGNPAPLKALLEEVRDVIFKVMDDETKDPRALFIRNPAYDDPKPTMGQLWGKHFYGVREAFCIVTNAAVLTVHKAQGSGRQHVFIDWNDISGPEARELKYTAVSRARQTLHILKGSR
jgi:AAA domain-containing protein/UvrD-like helicase family protein